MNLKRITEHWITGYLSALLITLALFYIRLSLDQTIGQNLNLAIFIPGCLLISLFFGLGPGVVSVGLFTILSLYYLAEPKGVAVVTELGDVVSVLVFLVTSLLVAFIAELYRSGLHNQRKAKYLLELQKDQLKQEVTERVLAQVAAKQGEAKYKNLADAMPQIVWVSNSEGRVVYSNKRWFEFCGSNNPDNLRDDWIRSIHPEDYDPMVRAWRQSVVDRLPFDYELRLLRDSDKSYRWHLIRGIPIFNEQCGIDYWIGTATDVEDYKQVANENQRLLEESKASSDHMRMMLPEILASVTDGRLRLCHSRDELPEPLPTHSSQLELKPESLRAFRMLVEEAAVSINFSPERWEDFVTAVGEATMNAVVHAGGGMGEVYCCDSGKLQVRITDTGSGISVNNLHRATLEKGFTTRGTLGHGFSLMLKMADRVWLYTGPDGTTVVLEQENTRAQSPHNWNEPPTMSRYDIL